MENFRRAIGKNFETSFMHITTVNLACMLVYMLQVNLFLRSICSNLGQFVSTKVNFILQ